MSPVTRARTRNKKKQKTPPAWLALWPVLLGVVVTPFAVWGSSVLAMSGPSALRLLYPYVTLAQAHAAHQLASNQEETLSQWVMYGQFPVYGLVWVVMRRLVSGTAATFSILMLHCLGVAAAILNASSN